MRSSRLRALPLILVLAILGLTPIMARATTESDVEQAEQARQQAYDRLVAVNQELDAALLDYHLINGELEELTYRIGVIVERITDHETSVEELTERARELVTEAYMSAGTGVFQVAFEAENIQDLLTSQVLIDRATDADLIELDRLDVVRREMDRLREELKQDQARVEDLSEAAADVVARLDDLQRAASAEYAKEDDAARAARAEYAEEQRRKELEEAARRSGAAGGVGAINGFICPVPGSRFINDWGFARSGGRTHKGTDMFASRGSAVVAVGNGVVTLKSNSLGGIVAYLRTSSANFYYAHLDGYAPGIGSGQSVSAGTVIGYVGNTGNALGTSPHLHFQIHPGGGAPVNPYPTVRAAC
jgi:murein DD-endopeptidase MepM/ murein hydrolase activator NlpD